MARTWGKTWTEAGRCDRCPSVPAERGGRRASSRSRREDATSLDETPRLRYGVPGGSSGGVWTIGRSPPAGVYRGRIDLVEAHGGPGHSVFHQSEVRRQCLEPHTEGDRD